MGEVRVKISLENATDLALVKAGVRQEVRAHETEAIVDTGAVMLALQEDVVNKLGLESIGTVIVTYADERKEELPVVGPVKLVLEGRTMVLEAVVIPPTATALIGQIPLERMDLHVDCVNRKLVPSPNSPILPLLNLK